MSAKTRRGKGRRAGARTDEVCPLLGVPTGASGRRALAHALLAAAARGEPAALVLVDVDEFDALNRLLGAERADDVLKTVARRVAAEAPDRGVLVRLAGDVLAIALPGLDLEQGLVLGQRACAAVARSPVSAGRGAAKRLAYPTVSAGVARFDAAQGGGAASLDEAIARAQAAIRRAKELGRGRVAAPPEDRMALKTSYYPQTQLARLRALAQRLGVAEAVLLRHALEELILKHKERAPAVASEATARATRPGGTTARPA